MKSFFDKSFLGYSLTSTNQDWSKCIFLLIQTKRKLLSMMKSTNYSWIRCLTTPSCGKIWKRLGHRKQIWKRRLTKFLQKSPNFFRNSRNFFHMLLRPYFTFGTISYKSFITGTPSKMVFFQKTWWKRVKEYSFNLFTERAIVEDCVAVILPPQLTL